MYHASLLHSSKNRGSNRVKAYVSQISKKKKKSLRQAIFFSEPLESNSQHFPQYSQGLDSHGQVPSFQSMLESDGQIEGLVLCSPLYASAPSKSEL